MERGGLDELIGTIAELDEFDEDEVWVDLREAAVVGDDGLTLDLVVRRGDTAHSDWRVTARGVAETSISIGEHALVEETDDHVLLLDHLDREESLYIGSAPADPRAVLAEVWVAHEDLMAGYRPLARYINTLLPPLDVLSLGYGMFGEGPATLVARYAPVLDAHGCRVSVVDRGPPKRWDAEGRLLEQPAGLTALLMPRLSLLRLDDHSRNDSWVLAAEFTAVRRAGVARSEGLETPPSDPWPPRDASLGGG